MAIVIAQEPAGDENCLVVWRDGGRPAYGTYFSHQSRHAAAHFSSEQDWDATIDAAVALAERNGIPTVYVVEGS